jgi:hypothetical protein
LDSLGLFNLDELILDDDDERSKKKMKHQ